MTISFNQAEFLEEALRSVLDQDYVNVEYIVVDPGSTDGSREIIARYRDRLATVILDPDKGPADGLNRGFAAASGEIFGYLNSDDMLLPGTLRRVVQTFQDDPAADLVYGHGFIADAGGTIVRRFCSNPFSLRRAAFGNCFLMQQATFYRRDAFLSVGGFNPANHTCWDSELWLDLALAHKKFKRVNEYWALFRDQENSITRNVHSVLDSRRAAYDRDLARCFEKVMKRSWRRSDASLKRLYRLEKWLTDPLNYLVRLWPTDYGKVARS